MLIILIIRVFYLLKKNKDFFSYFIRLINVDVIVLKDINHFIIRSGPVAQLVRAVHS